MGLILLITGASLGCAFLLYILARWLDDAKGKTARKRDSAPNPKQPYVIKTRNGPQTTRAAGTARRALLDGQRRSRSQTIP
jgi:hypothetical protein